MAKKSTTDLWKETIKENGWIPDYQAEKLYEWQTRVHHISNREDWTVEQCQAFVDYVWHCYFSSETPSVVEVSFMDAATANRYHLFLPRWARNREIVLHEIGHSILEHVHGHDEVYEKFSAHGPEFVRLFVNLLYDFGSITSYKETIKSLRDFGLRVAPDSKVPQPRSKRTRSLVDGKRKEPWMARVGK